MSFANTTHTAWPVGHSDVSWFAENYDHSGLKNVSLLTESDHSFVGSSSFAKLTNFFLAVLLLFFLFRSSCSSRWNSRRRQGPSAARRKDTTTTLARLAKEMSPTRGWVAKARASAAQKTRPTTRPHTRVPSPGPHPARNRVPSLGLRAAHHRVLSQVLENYTFSYTKKFRIS